MEFNLGDVVKLKSGGVNMVVIAFSEKRDYVKCVWQDVTASGTLPREYNFPVVAVEKGETSPIGTVEAGATEALSAAFTPEPESLTSLGTEHGAQETAVTAASEPASNPDSALPASQPDLAFPQPTPRRSSWLGARS